MKDIKLGFAICGSFCTHSKILKQLESMLFKDVQIFQVWLFGEMRTSEIMHLRAAQHYPRLALDMTLKV